MNSITALLVIISIIPILLVGVMAMTTTTVYAVHDERWTTIEVSIVNANVSRGYELSVGIPKAHSSLSATEDYIVGEETQYYNYNYDFKNIRPGTPFEVCVRETGD